MPPCHQHNFKLRKELSVRVIKAWLELLRLEDWAYWDIEQETITEVINRYNLSECMRIHELFYKNRFNCETLLKSTERYLSQSDLDRTLYEWVRTLEDEEDGNNKTWSSVSNSA